MHGHAQILQGLTCTPSSEVFGLLLVCIKIFSANNTLEHQEMDEADEIDFASGLQAFESKHFSRAIQLLSPLAIKGNADAQHRCAIMYQNGLGVAANPAAALQWMSASAEQGYAIAQHGLGFMYMEGDCVEQNGELAVHWFTQAAEQGLAGSQTTLAMMYEQGTLIEKDEAKANEWYQKAGF